MRANFIFALTIFLSYANLQQPQADGQDKKRNTDHIDDILLRPDPLGYDENDPNVQAVLKQLGSIYQSMIKPVEQQFRYADLRRHTMSDVDIHAKPLILLVGPWSTGKSTMINYLLGIEGALESLYVGAEPTTGDFTVVSYGDEYRTVEGVVLATDATKPFASMEKFGQIFLEHLLGVEMNSPLLRNVTFIDTPGILENRRQQERGYPYNDVMRWLVHRSDLIFVVFDPTKLDVGWELETLFKQLKGKESVLRIILNKADSISEQELMRVYGALFWSLSPLINVTEPPRVYVGSFWGEAYHDDSLGQVLLREEKSLLHDMREVIRNRVYNKIAFVRQYAIRVRIHALLIDSYVAAYRRNKGLFGNGEELAKEIIDDPESYDVFKTVLSHPNISKYDLPDPEEYEEFFRIDPLPDQRRISEHCGYFSECAIDQLSRAISIDLPILLRRFQNPNERARRDYKRPFDQFEMPNWKNRAASAGEPKLAPAQQQNGNGVSAASISQPQSGGKKYRKQVQATDAAPAAQVKQTPAPSKKSGKTVDAGASDKPKRRRRSKKEQDAAKEDAATKPAPKVVAEPGKIPEAVADEDDKMVEITVEEENGVEEEPPKPEAELPPASSRKSAGRKTAPKTGKQTVHSSAPAKPPVSVKRSRGTASQEKRSRKLTASREKVSRKDETSETTDGPKCNKFRKSCKEGQPSSTPVEDNPPEAPAKKTKQKSNVEEKKKSAPTRTVIPPTTPEASSNPPSKCNKYRKSCQNGESDRENVENPSGRIQKRAVPEPAPKSTPLPAAPASGVKCNKYRKSCQTEGSEMPKVTSDQKSKKAEAANPKKVPSSLPLSAMPLAEGRKCNKYRKSCQEGKSEESGRVEPKEKDQQRTKEKIYSQLDEESTSTNGLVKCTKYSYRISCRGKRDDDDDASESSVPDKSKKGSKTVQEDKRREPVLVAAPSAPPAAGASCNKYRKSCQQHASEGPNPITKTATKTTEKTTESKKTKEPETKRANNDGVKCNKYRKSCQQGSQSEIPSNANPSKERVVETRKSPSADSPNLGIDPSRPCNKYRKSCQQSMGLLAANGKPAKATPSANEPAGKAKKSCKKKNSTDSASATKQGSQKTISKSNPAASSNPEPPAKQNKWRKNKSTPDEKSDET